jgi:hypothetical protein
MQMAFKCLRGKDLDMKTVFDHKEEDFCHAPYSIVFDFFP